MFEYVTLRFAVTYAIRVPVFGNVAPTPAGAPAAQAPVVEPVASAPTEGLRSSCSSDWKRGTRFLTNAERFTVIEGVAPALGPIEALAAPVVGSNLSGTMFRRRALATYYGFRKRVTLTSRDLSDADGHRLQRS